ncbi:MAG TPA: ATP-dependent helicase, partial [Nitrospirota bacterium]|nr:ATP-dependent helicase [Nitrospirota bacterium]
PLVRSIERVLGDKIERRTLKDFDYRKSAPARDTEFARPPREPQHRRTRPKPEHAGHHAAGGTRPKTHQVHHQHQRSDVPRSSSAPAPHPSGTRTFKPRTHRHGP